MINKNEDEGVEPDAWLVGEKTLIPGSYPYHPEYVDDTKPLFSAETIHDKLKKSSLELEGYCTDHDRWIWEENHVCLKSKSCDIWQPRNSHIWADFAKQVFSDEQ